MSIHNTVTPCTQCKNDFQSNFCADCGRPKTLKRINGQYIVSEIRSILNFERGILYTIKELSLRPGKNIRAFIFEDRKRLVKPIVFIIVCSLFYALVQQMMNFEDGYINYNSDDWKDSAIGVVFQWISKNYGYANIFMAIFIASWIKILFRKYDYNFYEIIVLLCFVIGMDMLIYALFGVIEGFTKWPILQVGVNLGFIYNAWAIGQFFDQRKIINYLKGLLSYILGMLTFIFMALVLGGMIDLILR